MLKQATFAYFTLTLSSLFSNPLSYPEVVNFGEMKLFQENLLEDAQDSWTWQLGNTAFELGYCAFNDSPEIGAYVSLLFRDYKIDAVIETGTFLGATTVFFSDHMDTVYTIDVVKQVYETAKERLKNRSNIHCCLGSSEKVLHQLLPTLKDKRICVYIDAHGGCDSWPLLQELEEISKTHKDQCLLIFDDFRVPDSDIHGCLTLDGKQELSHDYIRDHLNLIFSTYDFHYLIPKNRSRSAKFVAIPKQWRNKEYVGRVDVLPGADFDDFPIDLTKVDRAGFALHINNQFFNGHDRGHYEEDIRYDKELAKIFVFNNTVDPSYLAAFPKEKLVLFLFEPLDLPPSYFDPCSRVYTWNDDQVDGVKFFKLYYPYLMPMQKDLPSFEKKKLCVMVSGSDNAYPERKNELYSERMKMVEFFESKRLGEFDIYGRFWNNRFYRDFRGSIPGKYFGPEKLSVLKQYRFCICFENTKDLNGYVTEKIFSCFAAGCVPIYWGAANIDKYIPRSCFIDYREFEDREELYQFIKAMPKTVYEQYIDNIRAFLESKEAQVFSPQYFGNLFYEAITESVDSDQ